MLLWYLFMPVQNDRALKLWESSKFVAPSVKSCTALFSADNYGDHGTIVVKNGKRVMKTIKRATQYMPTAERWDDSIWAEISKAAMEFLDTSPKRGKRAKGGAVLMGDASSEAVDLEPDFFIADLNWSD